MRLNRRQFVHTATLGSALSTLAGAAPDARLLPAEKEVWGWQTWMARLGPKYTGNAAHTEFVEFLATEMGAAGLRVERDHYKFPRWDATRWALRITPAGAAAFDAKVTSYFPYSGETGPAGVTGKLVYAGKSGSLEFSEKLRGNVALIECPTNERPYGEWYQMWGAYPASAALPRAVRPARSSVNSLEEFHKAGAVGVVLAWTDISDANAQDQYGPFSRPRYGIPGLWVGRDTGARLKALAAAGAEATVTLEATVTPDTPTDTLIATLDGSSAGESIILNTHTDGPNAIEENGALGLLALAKYFSRFRRERRRRGLSFVMTTGHFAGPWVPSIRGVIEKHPEVVKNAVAAVTVEHLGCMEWADDAQMRYRATGRNEMAMALSPRRKPAEIMLKALAGSNNQGTLLVNPVKGGFLGEGSSLARAGVPVIGYMPMPNYLLAGPKDGCIEKVNPKLLHGQIEMFARVVHGLDETSAAELKA